MFNRIALSANACDVTFILCEEERKELDRVRLIELGFAFIAFGARRSESHGRGVRWCAGCSGSEV